MQPVIIGLCGGIGSGKTTVAGFFRKIGCGVIDADKITRRLLDQKPIKKRLCQAFGQTIINKAGKIDRHVLAQKAFGHRRYLRKLNALIHPYIREEIKFRLTQQKNRYKTIVIDAALLLASPLAKICDFIIFVDAAKTIRCSRTRRTRKWLSNELVKRELFQISPTVKKRRADFIINNNFSLTQTYSRVKKIYRRMKYA